MNSMINKHTCSISTLVINDDMMQYNKLYIYIIYIIYIFCLFITYMFIHVHVHVNLINLPSGKP